MKVQDTVACDKRAVETIQVNEKRIADFSDIYSCPFEVVKSRDVKALAEQYRHALEQGRTEGFTPVFVVLDDILLEKIDIDMEDAEAASVEALFEANVRRSHEIDVEAFFKDKNDIKEGFEEDDVFDTSAKPYVEFMAWQREEDVLLLVKVPTVKPYEVLSYFPMGGFNDCPMPEVQTAVSKKWYEQYGAIPAVISSCEIEYYVQNPVRDIEAAKDLACEHYAFCVDIVEQGVGDVQALTDEIFDNVQWYFWWD